VFIMVTGAAVRLTGSGLGCPTWPTCEEDSFTPHSATDGHAMVEFTNRLVTGAVMLFTVAAVIGAVHRRPRRDDLFRWSLGLPVWVLANGLVGLLVVVLELTPISVIGHFLLSLGALWNAVVLHEKAGEPDPVGAGPYGDAGAYRDGGPYGDAGTAGPAGGARRRELAVPAVRRACDLLVLAAGLALATGTIVTGSGPHAGDEAADRLDFVVGDVARLHGIAVVLFLTLTLTVLAMAHRGDAAPSVGRRLRALLVVLVLQAGVGYTQYFTGVPALLVGVHVLGAAAVWIAVLRVRLGLSEPLADTSPAMSPVLVRPSPVAS
jgi:cytochrome c oxidase assembly protein subunit 15